MNEKPTREQCYSWYVNFQWGLAATEDYHQGMQHTFESAIPWLIENGFITLTDKGKNYIPEHKPL